MKPSPAFQPNPLSSSRTLSRVDRRACEESRLETHSNQRNTQTGTSVPRMVKTPRVKLSTHSKRHTRGYRSCLSRQMFQPPFHSRQSSSDIQPRHSCGLWQESLHLSSCSFRTPHFGKGGRFSSSRSLENPADHPKQYGHARHGSSGIHLCRFLLSPRSKQASIFLPKFPTKSSDPFRRQNFMNNNSVHYSMSWVHSLDN